MPLYDYECQSCGSVFEDFRPIAESGTAKCPECGKTAKKMISSFFSPKSGGTSGGGGCAPRGGGGG